MPDSHPNDFPDLANTMQHGRLDPKPQTAPSYSGNWATGLASYASVGDSLSKISFSESSYDDGLRNESSMGNVPAWNMYDGCSPDYMTLCAPACCAAASCFLLVLQMASLFFQIALGAGTESASRQKRTAPHASSGRRASSSTWTCLILLVGHPCGALAAVQDCTDEAHEATQQGCVPRGQQTAIEVDFFAANQRHPIFNNLGGLGPDSTVGLPHVLWVNGGVVQRARRQQTGGIATRRRRRRHAPRSNTVGGKR